MEIVFVKQVFGIVRMDGVFVLEKVVREVIIGIRRSCFNGYKDRI